MSESTTRVQKLSSADAADWIRVDGGIFVNDLIDQATAPAAAMTVGFARLGAGESLDISFPYDETLIVTKGVYTVRTAEGKELTAGPGEVIYLPGGSSNASHAVEEGWSTSPARRMSTPPSSRDPRNVRKTSDKT